MRGKLFLAFVLSTGAVVPWARAAGDLDLVDEDWVVAPREMHAYSFTLGKSTPVKLDVTPVKNTDKGFTVRLVQAEDVDACSGKAQGTCRSLGGFDGFNVRSLSHVEPVAPGRWTLFVSNTQNILNRATVHVHLVTQPAG